MDISLTHAGLAAGAALTVLPLILHLFMKQTPKHIVFPALRLIRERQKQSRKKLKVKNWLLLLARMALVALMALALARPRLFSQTSLGDQEVPTALALVFDTSLSMQYRERDKTRLDEAKERAADILKRLPDTSVVFVIDSASAAPPSPLSPSAARKQVDSLELLAANRSLNKALGQAYSLVAGCDQPRHEVYILTDLARSSWDTSHAVDGLEKAKADKAGVETYLLRLSPKEMTNVLVAEAQPSATVAHPGEAIAVQARIQNRGPAVSRTVEFYLDNVLRDKKQITLDAGAEEIVRFVTPKLDANVPIHQGRVGLSGAPDPLKFDDERFFTFKVQPAMSVLLVSDREVDATFVANALDPNLGEAPDGTPRPYRVESIRSSRFVEKSADELKRYTAVFLLNVAELTSADWGRLNAFVHEGGGLVIGLGERCSVESYNTPIATQLTPASLKAKEQPKPATTFGKVNDVTHPLFKAYHKELETLMSQIPVFRYWSIVVPEGTRPLLTFADNSPALVERTFRGVKNGRVLMWTTPLSRHPEPSSPSAWNEFPLPDYGWSFLYMMNETIPFLSGTSNEVLNYEAGQDVTLPIDTSRRFKNYIVTSADGRSKERLSPPVTSDSLVIVAPQPVGQWGVEATGPNVAPSKSGFSVNPPAEESRFVALETADLDVLFGKDRYQLADSSETLKKQVEFKRTGQEMFPWLMALILMLVTAENFLANRFYREAPTRGAAGAAA